MTAPISEASDFRALVRTHLLDSAEADPSVIAGKVLEQLTDAECRIALAATLDAYIHGVSSSSDRAVRRAPLIKGPSRPQRVAGWYAMTLSTRMLAGDTWKFLRDCTASDLHEAAALRYRTAAAVTAEADRWVRLADVMENASASTVADLDETALRSVFEPTP